MADANAILTPVVGHNSVFVRDGSDHAEARAQLRDPLLPQALAGYRPTITDLAARHTSRIADRPRTLRDEVRQFCMSTMTYVCFARADLDSAKEAARKIAPVLGVVTSTFAFVPALHTDLGPLSPVRYVKYRLRQFDEMLNRWIDEAIAAERPCVATNIARLEGVARSTPVIRDQVATTLIAGFEATAAAIEWVIFWVLRDPALVSDLRAEICAQEALGATQPPLDIDGPLLNSICKEALRITPPVDFYPRQLRTAPRGTRVVMVAPCSLTMHREEDIFPDPEKFCPTRFRDRNYSNHQYSVYGGGQWRCPGEGLSQIALKTFIAKLIVGYDVSLMDHGSPEWRRKTIVLIPKRLRIKSIVPYSCDTAIRTSMTSLEPY